MRPVAWCGFLACLSLIAACRSDDPPGCRIAQRTPLAANELTRTRNVTLHRTGDDFTLVGIDGDTVRWGSMKGDGTLGPVTSLTVPPRSLQPEPWVAVAGKQAPGDQLVVFYAAEGTSANQLDLFAITQDAGGEASEPRSVASLPAGAEPATIRIAAGSSRTGRRAVVAWGVEGPDGTPSFLLYGGDQGMNDPAPLPRPLYQRGETARWSCLSVVASHLDIGVSVTEPAILPGQTGWRIFEVKDDGGRGFEYGINFDVASTSCPVVAPTPLGYAVAYQNKEGSFFSEYDVKHNFVNSRMVAGALRFGGSLRQPAMGCLAPMGREFALLFVRDSGPLAWRFDAFGKPRGATLPLPFSGGQVGPVSTWPGQGQMHATYADIPPGSVGNSMGIERYLIRVECPMALPAFNNDGGADAGGEGGVEDGK